MPNMTPVRPGQVNGAGDPEALFLKLFSGEVLAAFERENQFLNRHMVRTIQSGRSAQFPATWRNSASYHTPGTLITGTNVNTNERVITIDDLLISTVSIANIDEAKNHWDYRSVFTTECGRALSNAMDRNVAQVAVLAARGSATVTGGNGGTRITAANIATNVTSLIDGISAAAQALDEKDVPKEDRCVFLSPSMFYLLLRSAPQVLSQDFSPNSQVDAQKGVMKTIFGMEIVVSNHIPSTNVTTGPTAYRGDFTATRGIVMHKNAVGTVKLLDLSVESDYLVQNQATLVVAKYACGHGILRPEAAVELATA